MQWVDGESSRRKQATDRSSDTRFHNIVALAMREVLGIIAIMMAGASLTLVTYGLTRHTLFAHRADDTGASDAVTSRALVAGFVNSSFFHTI